MSLRPKPYYQTLKDLIDASTKINDYAVSTDEILTFDENTDVLLPSGKFAKSLDKRLKEQFAQAVVLSVNDKTGDVKLEPSDIKDGNITQKDINDKIAQREYTNMIDLRSFGVKIPNTVEEAKALATAEKTKMDTDVYNAIKSLPQGATLYIPPNTYWRNLYTLVYDAMPKYTKIIDDSGYDARYGGIWQSASVVWYNTGDATETGGTNGNTHVLRSKYHSAFGIDNDCDLYTGGARSSIVFRWSQVEYEPGKFNRDMYQFGGDKTVLGQENIGISSYGDTYTSGTRVWKIGGQSSIAPHAMATNWALVAGTSYIWGKMAKTLTQTDEEWKAAPHVTRHAQPSTHTGDFTTLYLINTAIKFKQDINPNTGVVKFVNANSKGWSYGANAEVLGYRKTVTNSTGATVNLSTAFTCSIYTNNATTAAIDFKLPKAESGVYYTFHVTKATQLKISPNVADTIIGYTVGTPISSSTINDTVTLVAISATEWIMTSKIGNWV